VIHEQIGGQRGLGASKDFTTDVLAWQYYICRCHGRLVD